VNESAPFTRTELAQELDRNKIGNRMLFGGNLVRQPAFVQLRHDNPNAMRVSGDLPVADRIMNQTLFLGTYPGLTTEQIDFMVQVIRDFAKSKIALENSVTADSTT
jgi:CDP-6-deoxy-D-xylo-4-hexulose-3-dehydrase